MAGLARLLGGARPRLRAPHYRRRRRRDRLCDRGPGVALVAGAEMEEARAEAGRRPERLIGRLCRPRPVATPTQAMNQGEPKTMKPYLFALLASTALAPRATTAPTSPAIADPATVAEAADAATAPEAAEKTATRAKGGAGERGSTEWGKR